MANPMDAAFGAVPNAQPPQDMFSLVQQIKQNPAAFEEQIRRTNPQAYQQMLQIRNAPNPQAIVMQMAQQRGINPNILKMLGM